MTAKTRLFLCILMGMILTGVHLPKGNSLGRALGGFYWAAFGAAEGANRAGLVIDFGGGNVQTRCISFSEPTISGYELLNRSGLSLISEPGPMGFAVCKIGSLGCAADNCLTCMQPEYWSYWHLTNSSWVYSPFGSSNYTIQNGFVDAWKWGQGQGSPPASVSFEQICAEAATATPTSTEAPSATPPPPTTESPTQNVFQPTDTAIPTQTTPPTTAPTAVFNAQSPGSTNTPRPPTLAPVIPTTRVPNNNLASTAFPASATVAATWTVMVQDSPVPQAAATSQADAPPAATVSVQLSETPAANPATSTPVAVAIQNLQPPHQAENSLQTGAVADLATLPPLEIDSETAGNSKPSSVVGYFVFGALVAGLSGGLILVMMARRR